MNQDNRGEEKCEHNVTAKYCFRCKRPDLAGPTPTETDIANELACVLTNNEQGSFQKNLETAKEYLEAYSKILLTNQHTEHAKELEKAKKKTLKSVEQKIYNIPFIIIA